MIDDRTTNQDYPKPHTDNQLQEDVSRLRSAFDAIDADVYARLITANLLTQLLTVDGPTSGISVQYLGGLQAADFAPIAHVGSGATAHSAATSASAGFMTTTQVVKLTGIETGAQVNTITSVNIKVGDVVLTYADVNATPASHVGTGGEQHSVVTSASAGFMASADKVIFDKLSLRCTPARLYFLRG